MKRRKFLIGSGVAVAGASALWTMDQYGLAGNQGNPYLQGNFAPVKDQVLTDQLKVVGEIPKELSGLYLRNGPNPMTSPNHKKYHWFSYCFFWSLYFNWGP